MIVSAANFYNWGSDSFSGLSLQNALPCNYLKLERMIVSAAKFCLWVQW